ncbi:endoplasmic reticulum aminopeptidase 1-like [Arapaima gigas]
MDMWFCLCLLFSLNLVWKCLGDESFKKSFSASREPFPWNQSRLPVTIRPDHYFLYIHPNIASETFVGQVQILVTVLNDTNMIVLHSKGLTVHSAHLVDLTATLSEQWQLALQMVESQSRELLVFVSKSMLKKGHKYQLSISYNSTMSSSFSGLYKATYLMPNGTSRTLVATHFEPTSARRAFPCFDEPSLKAVFSLVIVREREYITLSNMPKGSTKSRSDGLKEDHYLTSVKMSTYLVAFVVCDFSFSTAETKRGLKVSVFAPSHQISQTHYALNAAVRILNFYEEYFQIPYPLPKIDLAAIPDFEAGAMENWGLLTFRETSLLYEQETDTLRSRLWVSLFVTAILSFSIQWFGNLVTMKWWNDLWLNEGFASYMEYMAVSYLEPSWSVENELFIMDVFRALARDSFLTSHPISVSVSDTEQIRQMFDVVSYSKGASIIRMLRVFLTENIFISGIRNYLQQHRYGSAQQDDLWVALSQTALMAGKVVDVKAVMDTWTMQRGYPIVSVRVQGTRILLHQQLFTKSPQNDTRSLWQIPFSFYTSNSSTVMIHLMTNKEEVITLEHEVSWIKANVNSSSFYRVSYEETALYALVSQLHREPAVFSGTDRAGLLDDIFHLASQGSVKYSEAFNLSLFLRNEKEFLPINVFLGHMMNMLVRFSFSRQPCIVHLLKEHVWRMLGKVAQAEHWEDGGSPSDENKRARLLALASGGLSRAAGQQALRLFHFWMAKDGNYSLPRTLKGLIFRVGVRKGNHAEWTFLLQKYQQAVSSKEKLMMLKALCQTSSEKKRTWQVAQSTGCSLNNHIIKTQDLAVVVEQLGYRPSSSGLVWKFLQQNWDNLLEKFSLGSSYLSRIVTSVTSKFNSLEKYNEVYNFFVTQKHLGHMSFVKLSLEMIQTNKQWLVTHTKPIQAWLQKEYNKAYKTYHQCHKEVTYHIRWGATIRFQL